LVPVNRVFFLIKKKRKKRERELKQGTNDAGKQPVVSSVRPSNKDWWSF